MPPDESTEQNKPKPDIEAGEDVESYDVEGEPPPRDAPRAADLKCPNCGAERDDGTLARKVPRSAPGERRPSDGCRDSRR